MVGAPPPAFAQVKLPEHARMTSVFPAGGPRGERVSVVIRGEFLVKSTSVIVSGGGIRVENLAEVGRGEARAELVIAPDAALGVRQVRLVTQNGVTDPAWFVVSRHREAVEKEPNDTASQAEPIPSPGILNARIGQDEDVDQFRVPARRGEPLVLAVEAFQLDAQCTQPNRFLDLGLTLYDAKGQVVASNGDHRTLDPALVYTPRADGDLILQLRDIGYRGGDQAYYRLIVGSLPYPVALYPAGGRRGSTVPVQVEGLNVPSGATASVPVPADAPSVMQVAPLDGMPNTRPFLAGDYPEVLEAGDNDRVAGANLAAVPSTVNGRLEKAADVDHFALDLKQGEGIVIDVLAGRVLRSPVDLVLTILDASGKELARNDDGQFTFTPTANRSDSLSGDPWLEFVAPAPGRYYFSVRDVGDRGGEGCVYRATVTRREPSFRLYTGYDTPQVKGPGSAAALVVRIQRWGGFSGEVRVRPLDLPVGWEGSEGIINGIAANRNPESTIITLRPPPDAPVGTVVPFRVEGVATINGESRRVLADAITHFGQNSDHSIFRPADTLRVCVTPQDDFQVRARQTEFTAAPGQRVMVPVTIDRAPGYTGEVGLVATRGNQLFFGAPVTIPKGAVEAEVPVPIPTDAPPGRYTFTLVRPIYGDLRLDKPSVCTQLIAVDVKAP